MLGFWTPSNYTGCAQASSDYKWFSSDMGIVSVSASGVVQAKKPGKATIKVLSSFDSFNYDEVQGIQYVVILFSSSYNWMPTDLLHTYYILCLIGIF